MKGESGTEVWLIPCGPLMFFVQLPMENANFLILPSFYNLFGRGFDTGEYFSSGYYIGKFQIV